MDENGEVYDPDSDISLEDLIGETFGLAADMPLDLRPSEWQFLANFAKARGESLEDMLQEVTRYRLPDDAFLVLPRGKVK